MTGPEIGALSDALCDAFDLRTFDRMLHTRLGRRRDTIAADGPMSAVAFETITAAVREGWERDLIREAVEFVPNNSRLRKYCLDHPHIAPPVPSPRAEFPLPVPSPPPVVHLPKPPASPNAGERGWWKWLTPRRLVGGAALVLVAVGIIWLIVSKLDGRQQGMNGTETKQTNGTKKIVPITVPSGLVPLDDNKTWAEVRATFKQLATGGLPPKTAKVRLGVWLAAPLSHQDWTALKEMTEDERLKIGNARVIAVGAADKDLHPVILSGFGMVVGSWDQLLKYEAKDEGPINTIVFVGLFRNPVTSPKVKGPFTTSQVTPVVAACMAGKDCFITLTTEDKASWRRYLSKSAPKETRDALDEAKNTNRLLYASIPNQGATAFTNDFPSFFIAIRDRKTGLPGSVEKLE